MPRPIDFNVPLTEFEEEVDTNKRRAKERVREAKKTARIEWLYRNRGWIIPVGYVVIAYLLTLALEAVS